MQQLLKPQIKGGDMMKMSHAEILEQNRKAWDKRVEENNEWTIPVDSGTIEKARLGDWSIVLTPTKPVPREWFPKLTGADVLCLASGGGQQGPVLAAAGAHVTVFDNSPKQLARDLDVAKRDGLSIRAVQGDMADLSVFPDASFDIIVHPVSNCYVPDVLPVWREAYRVLRKGGVLLSGFNNPAVYIFDDAKLFNEGVLEVTHKLPCSTADGLTDEELREFYARGEACDYSHTLTTLIGGQTGAGFVIDGFYEDIEPGCALTDVMPWFIATRARKI